MKTVLLSTLLVISSVLLFSCNGAEKKASEKVINDFYSALRQNDSTAIKKVYPAFDKLGGFFKSKRIEFKNFSSLDNDKYDVEIQNHFTNGNGKKFSQTIHFLLKKEGKDGNKMMIYDSKGLNDFKEEKSYQFAVKTGFIAKRANLTDQEIAENIKKSQGLIEIYYKELVETLRKDVVIENWGWKYGYVETYADGSGRVCNRSKYDFSTVKFMLSFVDASGNITKTDEGYLVYAQLKSGQSSDFTTLTSDIGPATKAYIQIQFDTLELLDIIYDRKYKGNEAKLVM